MPPVLSRYTIIAQRGTHEQSATRISPYSAMVLADRWTREGCESVSIVDREGVSHSPKAFRHTLPGIRKKIEF